MEDNEKEPPESVEAILTKVLWRLRRIDLKFNYLCDQQKEIIQNLKHVSERVEALGKSCASGFYQTRDAAECLREELASNTGTLISATDCDWKDLSVLRV